MKRLSVILLSVVLITLVDAKLAIRSNRFADRVARCCYDQRGWYEPRSAADAEDEVNRLRMEVINEYDDGVYIAKWRNKRRRLLDIQTKLGYTVPERYSWGW